MRPREGNAIVEAGTVLRLCVPFSQKGVLLILDLSTVDYNMDEVGVYAPSLDHVGPAYTLFVLLYPCRMISMARTCTRVPGREGRPQPSRCIICGMGYTSHPKA